MHLDPLVVAASAGVGLMVGLTGMGGGALLTPILVLAFGVAPTAAVSSDLVAALVMRPVGGIVHLRRGRVITPLLGWLVAGSVPSAFAGVLVVGALGSGPAVEHRLQLVLGAALLLATAAIVVKGRLQRRRGRLPVAPAAEAGVGVRAGGVRAGGVRAGVGVPAGGRGPAASLVVRPWATVLVGAAGGLVVGMTSVGSGSLMMVLLVLVYPDLSFAELVGTDLVQAVPLVAAAALGHLVFGDVRLGLTASLVLGSVPGVYAGARLSSVAPDRVIRPLLSIVLLATGLELLGLGP